MSSAFEVGPAHWHTERFGRWVAAGYSAGGTFLEAAITAQGLGALDGRLIREGELLLADAEPETLGLALRRTEHFTLSALWVFGAYELARALDERVRRSPSDWLGTTELADAKRQLARVRMPLAKFEQASTAKQAFAWPLVDPVKGASWRLSPTLVVSRLELSEATLDALGALKRKAT